MTSCVKWLAVPGPPPGPWDAHAALAESKAAADVKATAKRDIQRDFRTDAMTI
jgi:hypothetical protein